MIGASLIFSFIGLVWFFALLTESKHPVKFRWSKSKWGSKDGEIILYDKIEHCIGTALLTLALYGLSKWLWPQSNALQQAFWSACIFGGCWEIKDSFYPWEIFGWLGGDGYCIKDFISDVVGATLTVGIIYMVR